MACDRGLICGLRRTNWDRGVRMVDSLALAAHRRLYAEQLSDEKTCERCDVGGSGLHRSHRMLLGCVVIDESRAFLVGSAA